MQTNCIVFQLMTKKENARHDQEEEDSEVKKKDEMIHLMILQMSGKPIVELSNPHILTQDCI